MNLKPLSVSALLQTHSEILDELRRRGVMRSANNPTGDYAEWLFCSAFGWKQAANSVKGYDATDADGIRYQIKGRRLHQHNSSRQLSAIRDLNGFDILAGVLLDARFDIARAALIPSEVVSRRASYSRHTNSQRFHLRDEIWQIEGVRDVTSELRLIATRK